MLIIKTSGCLRTMRNVKSYRSCPTSTGQPMRLADTGRRCQEDFLLRQRELRHRWLAAARRRYCCQG
jgi:hypothetical protein